MRFMRGPSLTYASVTRSSSTSTLVNRLSQLAIAERRTFSTVGASLLFAARRILMALPARSARIRSTTRRAFCGDVRMYRASALHSISLTPRYVVGCGSWVVGNAYPTPYIPQPTSRQEGFAAFSVEDYFAA